MHRNNGMLTFLRKAGRIHAAGPRSWQRYYSTAEQAARAAPRIEAHAKMAEAHRRRVHNTRRALKLRSERAAKTGRCIETRPDRRVTPSLPAGAIPAPGIKVTIAPPIRDRWAPAPGWVGPFVSEWRARRGE